ncbi:ankyrin repeat and SOCS box protein 13-like isoform X1 [Haliotis rufescens]|uniref:ankyrin repeat and SOCS box protein 13-like isoform X1 n=1 Tax=Haliotis rufescens TaxID=6454 RepID=UPI00201E9BDD|nr:ankyrin repeat and SOCS box protein 13-like isoform X1 [Haliotis rufescens]
MTHFCHEIEADVQEFITTYSYPLHEAARQGKADVVRHLTEEKDFFVNHQTFDLVTPLHHACLYGRQEVIKILLDKGAMVNARNIDGATPLCDACCYGDIEVVHLLLSHGADVNPPLLLSSPLHEAVLRDNWQCASVLLDAGANLNATDCHYGTPLHVAAYKGNQACAEVLLLAGADVNTRQIHKMPIHDVARLQDCEFLSLLLEHGANVYARDNHGRSPRDLVPSSTSPAKQLLLHWEMAVKSLQHLCRLVVRCELHKQRCLTQVDRLALPKFLKDYLAFE